MAISDRSKTLADAAVPRSPSSMDTVFSRQLKDWEVDKRELRISNAEVDKIHELLGMETDQDKPLTIQLEIVFEDASIKFSEGVMKKRRDRNSWNLYIKGDGRACFRDCPIDREAHIRYTGHDNMFQLSFGEQKNSIRTLRRKTSFSIEPRKKPKLVPTPPRTIRPTSLPTSLPAPPPAPLPASVPESFSDKAVAMLLKEIREFKEAVGKDIRDLKETVGKEIREFKETVGKEIRELKETADNIQAQVQELSKATLTNSPTS